MQQKRLKRLLSPVRLFLVTKTKFANIVYSVYKAVLLLYIVMDSIKIIPSTTNKLMPETQITCDLAEMSELLFKIFF